MPQLNAIMKTRCSQIFFQFKNLKKKKKKKKKLAKRGHQVYILPLELSGLKGTLLSWHYGDKSS